jgi:RNA polymerase sigma factor (sigma-70 family)
MPDHDAAPARRAFSPALHGDEEALYRTHAGRLWRIVRSRVRGDDALIDDACAAAWLILLRAQPRRDTAFAWLVTVAEHEAWRLARAGDAHAPLVPALPSGDVPPLDAPGEPRDPLAPMHARERLHEVAATLPERKLRIVALQALGYSYTEIAALTGDTPRTVDRQLRRAKRLLDPLREPAAA